MFTDKVSVLTLVQAERLARRRLLKLVTHTDVEMESKGGRPVYKLITSKEYTDGKLWLLKTKKTTSSYIKVIVFLKCYWMLIMYYILISSFKSILVESLLVFSVIS